MTPPVPEAGIGVVYPKATCLGEVVGEDARAGADEEEAALGKE